MCSIAYSICFYCSLHTTINRLNPICKKNVHLNKSASVVESLGILDLHHHNQSCEYDRNVKTCLEAYSLEILGNV